MKVALTPIARKLRHETTDAELRLWLALRNRQIKGFKFKRQVPFGPYIADLLCVEARLIVEADGGQHAVQEASGRTRTAYLESQGYRVLRFWNNDVLQNLEGVLETIAETLGSESPLTLTLSPRGEGKKAAALSREVVAAADPIGAAASCVPSPLGEKDRMRGSSS